MEGHSTLKNKVDKITNYIKQWLYIQYLKNFNALSIHKFYNMTFFSLVILLLNLLPYGVWCPIKGYTYLKYTLRSKTIFGN